MRCSNGFALLIKVGEQAELGIFGPCPISARKRPKIAFHADHFVARHVLNKMPTRPLCKLGAPTIAELHCHAPLLI